MSHTNAQERMGVSMSELLRSTSMIRGNQEAFSEQSLPAIPDGLQLEVTKNDTFCYNKPPSPSPSQPASNVSPALLCMEGFLPKRPLSLGY